MEKELAQFKLDDGTAFLVEVDEPRTTTRGGSGVQRVAADRTGQLVLEANQTLEDALEQVKPVIATVASRRSCLSKKWDRSQSHAMTKVWSLTQPVEQPYLGCDYAAISS